MGALPQRPLKIEMPLLLIEQQRHSLERPRASFVQDGGEGGVIDRRVPEARIAAGAERPRIRSRTTNKAWGGHNTTTVLQRRMRVGLDKAVPGAPATPDRQPGQLQIGSVDTKT